MPSGAKIIKNADGDDIIQLLDGTQLSKRVTAKEVNGRIVVTSIADGVGESKGKFSIFEVKTSINDIPNGGVDMLTPNQKILKEALDGNMVGAEIVPRGARAKQIFEDLNETNILESSKLEKTLNIETKKLDIDYEL